MKCAQTKQVRPSSKSRGVKADEAGAVEWVDLLTDKVNHAGFIFPTCVLYRIRSAHTGR